MSVLLLFLINVILLTLASAEIFDPANIFCGKADCYEVLGLQRSASIKEIKSAFRNLSLVNHPDKNKDENATEVFRLISKAYKVLATNESKALFDYYLDHPRVCTINFSSHTHLSI